MHKSPVPRLAEAVVLEWADDLAPLIGQNTKDLRQNTELIAFPHDTVRVELMDQSVVEFRYALFVVSEAKRAIAVFTEHCGHHVLPYHEAKVFVGGELRYSQGLSQYPLACIEDVQLPPSAGPSEAPSRE